MNENKWMGAPPVMLPPPGLGTAMDTARVVQLIETTLLRRGEGKDRSDPIRIITQYWTLDGRLLWELDPIKELRQWFSENEVG